MMKRVKSLEEFKALCVGYKMIETTIPEKNGMPELKSIEAQSNKLTDGTYGAYIQIGFFDLNRNKGWIEVK